MISAAALFVFLLTTIISDGCLAGFVWVPGSLRSIGIHADTTDIAGSTYTYSNAYIIQGTHLKPHSGLEGSSALSADRSFCCQDQTHTMCVASVSTWGLHRATQLPASSKVARSKLHDQNCNSHNLWHLQLRCCMHLTSRHIRVLRSRRSVRAAGRSCYRTSSGTPCARLT
jgi:hypothetical protein